MILEILELALYILEGAIKKSQGFPVTLFVDFSSLSLSSSMDVYCYVKSLSKNLSNESINTGVLVAFKTKCELRYQNKLFFWKQHFFCSHYWEFLTGFLMQKLMIYIWRCRKTAHVPMISENIFYLFKAIFSIIRQYDGKTDT